MATNPANPFAPPAPVTGTFTPPAPAGQIVPTVGGAGRGMKPVSGTARTIPRPALPGAAAGGAASASGLARANPWLLAYTLADVAVEQATGKGISQRAGEGIGGAVGSAIYGDGSQPALSDEELAQISKGINPATGTLVDPPSIQTPENFGIPEMDKLGDMPTGAFTPPSGPSSVAPQQLPSILPPVEQQIPQPAPTFAPEGSELTNAQFMGLSPDSRSAVTPNRQPIDVIGNNGESVSPGMAAPEGMRRTIDPLTGNVIFASEDIANQIGAQETERLQAQQRAQAGMTEHFLNQALQPTDYDRESAAREQRLTQRQEEGGARGPDKGPKTYGGFKASELRDMVGGGENLQRAKALASAGRDPITGSLMPKEDVNTPEPSKFQTRKSELQEALDDGVITQEQYNDQLQRHIRGNPPEGYSSWSQYDSEMAGSGQPSGSSSDLPDNMPSASDFKGRTIEDANGNQYKSDGKNWTKV